MMMGRCVGLLQRLSVAQAGQQPPAGCCIPSAHSSSSRAAGRHCGALIWCWDVVAQPYRKPWTATAPAAATGVPIDWPPTLQQQQQPQPKQPASGGDAATSSCRAPAAASRCLLFIGTHGGRWRGSPHAPLRFKNLLCPLLAPHTTPRLAPLPAALPSMLLSGTLHSPVQ